MTFNDQDIATQLLTAYIGCVKIKQLDQLVFEEIDIFGSRAFDETNIDRLIHRFDNEGCRRLDPDTWIPCEINLPDGVQIQCFQGKHRIGAARAWLAPNDIWWIFEVYDKDKLSPECRRRLRESNKRYHAFSDGEIFRSVRHYQQIGEHVSAGEWLARWSPNKCREFNRIYQPKRNHQQVQDLGERLDSLLCFPALWTSWHMGTHLLSLRCPEELSDSLSEICSAWHKITCNNPHLLDLRTLERLQGRHPALSLADRQYIREAFQQGEIFRYVDDSHLRAQMLDASLSYPMMIPSLKTFLENTKYMKAMTDVIKKILPSNSKGTIRQTMLRYYMMSENQTFSIQCSENSYIERQAPGRYGFWSAYRQVYLFAMRNFCGLTDCHPLGFTRASKARCPDSFEVWERFRNLISRVGFAFPGSKKVRQDRADLVAIRAFVSHSIQACDRFETWCLENRCGMTDTESFFYDQKHLFLDNVYSPNQLARESVTTFAVKRNIFKSFFLDFE
ncbi:hypothetical protein BO71DRAFT_457304, partial [Aspergillus ellipticus CBS 707.79]